jgi:hypothetical protein
MQQAKWPGMAVMSLFSMAMGIFFLLFYDSQLQAEDNLLQASGQLSWVKKHRYGLSFALKDQPQMFAYSRNSGASDKVKKVLEAAGEKIVSLRYEKETHGPIYSDDRYHSVWEIQIDQQVVRTYPQIKAAITADEKLVPWLGWGFFCSGLYFAHIARKSYRIMKRNAQYHHLFPWS